MLVGLRGAWTVHVCSKTREDEKVPSRFNLPCSSIMGRLKGYAKPWPIRHESLGFRQRIPVTWKYQREESPSWKPTRRQRNGKTIVSSEPEFWLHLSEFQASFDCYNLTLLTSLVEIPVFSPPYPPLPSPPL